MMHQDLLEQIFTIKIHFPLVTKEKSVQVDQLDMEIPMDEASNQADVVPSAQHLAFQPLRTVDGTGGDWWR